MNEPALYTRANGQQRHDSSYFSAEFADEIGEISGRCIDIGSGPGDSAVDLILPKLNENASLVCSDISEEMMNYGKAKYKDNERLSFVKLDIESPDLPINLVEQFDHATSFYCLHWCQDMRQVFANIFNLLRPGGTAFLIFIANYPGLNAYKKLAAMPRYQPYMKDVDRYIPLFQHSLEPRKTLKALIEDVHFEVQHCSVRERTYIFDSPETFRDFLLAVNPFKKRMPADLGEKYKEDLLIEVAKHMIVFNKHNNNEDEYSILTRYHLFVAYLKKPSSA